jgi:hypothetical protein
VSSKGMSKCKEDTKYDRTLLYGLPEIARYTGFCVMTIRRWKNKHGFPIYKLPDGVWQTSTELIDRWGMARENVRLGVRES